MMRCGKAGAGKKRGQLSVGRGWSAGVPGRLPRHRHVCFCRLRWAPSAPTSLRRKRRLLEAPSPWFLCAGRSPGDSSSRRDGRAASGRLGCGHDSAPLQPPPGARPSSASSWCSRPQDSARPQICPRVPQAWGKMAALRGGAVGCLQRRLQTEEDRGSSVSARPPPTGSRQAERPARSSGGRPDQIWPLPTGRGRGFRASDQGYQVVRSGHQSGGEKARSALLLLNLRRRCSRMD